MPSQPPSLPTLEVLRQRSVGLWEALPDEVGELAQAFADAGHELALVGGPVRDAFLGRSTADLDFTTSARPEETERLLSAWTRATWDIGREFGTIGARRGNVIVEVTTYRADAYDGDTRKPIVAFGDSLEEDLARRDFADSLLRFVDEVGSGLVAHDRSDSGDR